MAIVAQERTLGIYVEANERMIKGNNVISLTREDSAQRSDVLDPIKRGSDHPISFTRDRGI